MDILHRTLRLCVRKFFPFFFSKAIHSIVSYNALVHFHEDDTAGDQKTDCDGGTIYFWARQPCHPHDPHVSWTFVPPSLLSGNRAKMATYFRIGVMGNDVTNPGEVGDSNGNGALGVPRVLR